MKCAAFLWLLIVPLKVALALESTDDVGERQSDSGSGFKLGWDQSVRVVGALRCRNKPAADAHVALYDHDRFDADDLLDHMATGNSGYFEVAGATDSVMTIVPEIYIQFICGDDGPKCFRLPIPSSVVTWHAQPKNSFDMGTLVLDGLKSNAECPPINDDDNGGGDGGEGGGAESFYKKAKNSLNETFGIRW